MSLFRMEDLKVLDQAEPLDEVYPLAKIRGKGPGMKRTDTDSFHLRCPKCKARLRILNVDVQMVRTEKS